MAHGRTLPPGSAFSSDDGSQDPELAAALARYARDGDPAPVIATLPGKRLLIPMVAELESAGVTADGLTVDKEASVAVVAVDTPDGRRAMPVFSSMDTMRQWRPDARPVPAETQRAALSAVAEGWDILILDPAGPVALPIPRPAVWALGQNIEWAAALQNGTVASEIVDAVTATVISHDLISQVDVLPGTRAEVAVAITLPPGLSRTGLNRVVQDVNGIVAGLEVVAERVDSVEIRLRSQSTD